MSKITKAKNFMLLLLTCSKPQARALIETASPDQVLALSETILNILTNQKGLTSKGRSTITRHRKLLERIGSRKLLEKTKYSLVRNHWKLVWTLVLEIKAKLKQLLS